MHRQRVEQRPQVVRHEHVTVEAHELVGVDRVGAL